MPTKIQLSSFEAELLNDPVWILTKNNVIQKAKLLLEAVQENMQDFIGQYPGLLPEEVIRISPKISKGENYLGLPWLMLDYPRFFEKEHVFAIRTMFWWGKFFSTTLHISGKYKQAKEAAIMTAYPLLVEQDIYSCINMEEWHHHLEKENYLPVSSFTEKEFALHVQQRSFIKLSQKVSFTEWDHAINLLVRNFAGVIGWLYQLPRR